MLGARANTVFLVASTVTFVSLATVVVLTIIDLTVGLPSVSFGNSIVATVGFGLFVLVAAVCIVAQLVLWLGMIWITLADNQPLLFKVPLILAQLVFMSIGSAIVYLAFYRSGSKHATRLKVSDI